MKPDNDGMNNVNKNASPSRRKFIQKASAGVALTALVSQPARASICSISGFASVSPSGQVRHGDEECGYSHGAWKNPESGNGAGSRGNWYQTGIAPHPRMPDPNNSKKLIYKSDTQDSPYDTIPGQPYAGDPNDYNDDPKATFWEDVGFYSPVGSDTYGKTFYEVINMDGTIHSEAAKVLLNSIYLGWDNPYDPRIAPNDVIGLYNAYESGAPSYTTSTGAIIDFSVVDVPDFFAQAQH